MDRATIFVAYATRISRVATSIGRAICCLEHARFGQPRYPVRRELLLKTRLSERFGEIFVIVRASDCLVGILRSKVLRACDPVAVIAYWRETSWAISWRITPGRESIPELPARLQKSLPR